MPLHIIRQDITKVNCDAIVNPTNRKMVGYSGVDYAIHTAAGPQLDEECKKIYPLGLGSAKITSAYNLPAKYVIHTSGPIWQGGYAGESAILKSCYIESLKLATEHGCNSIAFPLISSGAYGYPKDQVLKFAIDVITEYLFENELTVYLCVYDKTSYEFSKKLFADIVDFIGENPLDIRQFSYSEKAFFEEKSEHPSAPYEIVSASYAPIVKRQSASPRREVKASYPFTSKKLKSLKDYVTDLEKPFIDTLFEYIDKKGITDVECYKKANVDRKTFNKLKNNPNQRPSKQIAVAFAIALKLNLEETQHLLSTASLTLSKSSVFDKIIRYFIHTGNYDIYQINEALFEFDQISLGSFYH